TISNRHWSSDVCSSDLCKPQVARPYPLPLVRHAHHGCYYFADCSNRTFSPLGLLFRGIFTDWPSCQRSSCSFFRSDSTLCIGVRSEEGRVGQEESEGRS